MSKIFSIRVNQDTATTIKCTEKTILNVVLLIDNSVGLASLLATTTLRGKPKETYKQHVSRIIEQGDTIFMFSASSDGIARVNSILERSHPRSVSPYADLWVSAKSTPEESVGNAKHATEFLEARISKNQKEIATVFAYPPSTAQIEVLSSPHNTGYEFFAAIYNDADSTEQPTCVMQESIGEEDLIQILVDPRGC